MAKSHFTVLLFILFVDSCQSSHKEQEVKTATVDGVQLHYKIEGQGEPIIFIHGSVVDLRYWKKQLPVFSKQFQVITYSRRYNYPNNNELMPNHSSIVEARDLLGLMNELKIEKAHIVGHSYGGYTALLFAIDHPERVKKLILAEPPLLRWLPELPHGEGRFERFMSETWIPIGKAFTENRDREALELTCQWGFHAPLDSIPEEWRNYLLQNTKEWRALTTSDDAYPKIEYSRVQNLQVPTLLLSGAQNAGNDNDLIDAQLTRLLPNHKRVIIGNAGHEMFVDNAKDSNQAVLDFLKD